MASNSSEKTAGGGGLYLLFVLVMLAIQYWWITLSIVGIVAGIWVTVVNIRKKRADAWRSEYTKPEAEAVREAASEAYSERLRREEQDRREATERAAWRERMREDQAREDAWRADWEERLRAERLRRAAAAGRRDNYTILGIPHNSTETIVKKAYRNLALTWHPDRVAGVKNKKIATEKFKELSNAYEAIMDSLRQHEMSQV